MKATVISNSNRAQLEPYIDNVCACCYAILTGCSATKALSEFGLIEIETPEIKEAGHENTCYILHEVCGMSYSKIADLLHIKIAKVRYAIAKIKQIRKQQI